MWHTHGFGAGLSRSNWAQNSAAQRFQRRARAFTLSQPFPSHKLAMVGVIAIALAQVVLVPVTFAAGRAIDAIGTGKPSKGFTGAVSRAAIVVKKSRVVDLSVPYATALIAEAEIADVVPLSDYAIYVLGKKVGTTRLTVVDEHQRVLKIVEIEVTPDIDDLKAKLRETVPDANIQITSVNGGLVLSGTVQDAPEIEKIVAIAKRYAPDAVTNSLSVASPQQVMLEVRFVEASRTASREFGISTRTRGPSAAGDTGDQIFDPGTSAAIQAAAIVSGTAPFGSMIARVLEGGTNVDVMIRALEERSLVRRLAEPNLITTSGDTASFLAGGEFPIPISAANNQIAIEFKQFGVALAFTPTVLSHGLINLKIAPEVSDIDDTNTVDVGGVRVPGLVVRRANTTVELKDGQSLAIAGLLQHQNSNTIKQLPWIGQVPILGALFRSSGFQKSESDLVIIVTPRLVKPKRPGEVLQTPLDKPVAANDVDLFVNGRQEITEADKRRREEPKQVGHIIYAGGETAANAPTK